MFIIYGVFQIGYADANNQHSEIVDIAALGGFSNLVSSSNFNQSPKFAFSLGETSKHVEKSYSINIKKDVRLCDLHKDLVTK